MGMTGESTSSESLRDDLESLRTLELPKDNPPTKLVKASVFLIVVAIVLAVSGLLYAVVVLAKSKSDLESQLSCLRAPSVEYDKRIGEGVNLMVELQLGLTDALSAVGTDDPATLQEAIVTLQQTKNDGALVQQNIDKAIKDREQSIQTCDK